MRSTPQNRADDKQGSPLSPNEKAPLMNICNEIKNLRFQSPDASQQQKLNSYLKQSDAIFIALKKQEKPTTECSLIELAYFIRQLSSIYIYTPWKENVAKLFDANILQDWLDAILMYLPTQDQWDIDTVVIPLITSIGNLKFIDITDDLYRLYSHCCAIANEHINKLSDDNFLLLFESIKEFFSHENVIFAEDHTNAIESYMTASINYFQQRKDFDTLFKMKILIACGTMGYTLPSDFVNDLQSELLQDLDKFNKKNLYKLCRSIFSMGQRPHSEFFKRFINLPKNDAKDFSIDICYLFLLFEHHTQNIPDDVLIDGFSYLKDEKNIRAVIPYFTLYVLATSDQKKIIADSLNFSDKQIKKQLAGWSKELKNKGCATSNLELIVKKSLQIAKENMLSSLKFKFETSYWIESLSTYVDFLIHIDNHKIILQVDGPSHFHRLTIEQDSNTKLNTALLTKLGYQVIRINYKEIGQIAKIRFGKKINDINLHDLANFLKNKLYNYVSTELSSKKSPENLINNTPPHQIVIRKETTSPLNKINVETKIASITATTPFHTALSLLTDYFSLITSEDEKNEIILKRLLEKIAEILENSTISIIKESDYADKMATRYNLIAKLLHSMIVHNEKIATIETHYEQSKSSSKKLLAIAEICLSEANYMQIEPGALTRILQVFKFLSIKPSSFFFKSWCEAASLKQKKLTIKQLVRTLDEFLFYQLTPTTDFMTSWFLALLLPNNQKDFLHVINAVYLASLFHFNDNIIIPNAILEKIFSSTLLDYCQQFSDETKKQLLTIYTKITDEQQQIIFKLSSNTKILEYMTSLQKNILNNETKSTSSSSTITEAAASETVFEAYYPPSGKDEVKEFIEPDSISSPIETSQLNKTENILLAPDVLEDSNVNLFDFELIKKSSLEQIKAHLSIYTPNETIHSKEFGLCCLKQIIILLSENTHKNKLLRLVFLYVTEKLQALDLKYLTAFIEKWSVIASKQKLLFNLDYEMLCTILFRCNELNLKPSEQFLIELEERLSYKLNKDPQLQSTHSISSIAYALCNLSKKNIISSSLLDLVFLQKNLITLNYLHIKKIIQFYKEYNKNRHQILPFNFNIFVKNDDIDRGGLPFRLELESYVRDYSLYLKKEEYPLATTHNMFALIELYQKLQNEQKYLFNQAMKDLIILMLDNMLKTITNSAINPETIKSIKSLQSASIISNELIKKSFSGIIKRNPDILNYFSELLKNEKEPKNRAQNKELLRLENQKKDYVKKLYSLPMVDLGNVVNGLVHFEYFEKPDETLLYLLDQANRILKEENSAPDFNKFSFLRTLASIYKTNNHIKLPAIPQELLDNWMVATTKLYCPDSWLNAINSKRNRLNFTCDDNPIFDELENILSAYLKLKRQPTESILHTFIDMCKTNHNYHPLELDRIQVLLETLIKMTKNEITFDSDSTTSVNDRPNEKSSNSLIEKNSVSEQNQQLNDEPVMIKQKIDDPFPTNTSTLINQLSTNTLVLSPSTISPTFFNSKNTAISKIPMPTTNNVNTKKPAASKLKSSTSVFSPQKVQAPLVSAAQENQTIPVTVQQVSQLPAANTRPLVINNSNNSSFSLENSHNQSFAHIISYPPSYPNQQLSMGGNQFNYQVNPVPLPINPYSTAYNNHLLAPNSYNNSYNNNSSINSSYLGLVNTPSNFNNLMINPSLQNLYPSPIISYNRTNNLMNTNVHSFNRNNLFAPMSNNNNSSSSNNNNSYNNYNRNNRFH